MRGLAIALLFVCVGGAGTALAQAPSTMSYQGVLTDAGGNIVPDGAYNLTFKIYDVPGAGAALWTENWFGVAVAKGGFSVLLGSSTPLALPFDKQYWLGIAVGGGGEMTPRVQLASSPYGLSLRLPFTGTSADPNQTLKISNTGGGAAIVANPGLTVGSPSTGGYFQWFGNGSASPYGQAGSYAGFGGSLYVNDESGSTYWGVEPDFDGIGAFWYMNGAGSGAYYDAEQSSGAGAMVFYGPGGVTSFNTGDVGDNAVNLPPSSVSAYETFDEPGVSQGKVDGTVVLVSSSSASLDNVVGTSITIPAPGYVEVEISGQAGIVGFLGSNTTGFQIDETGAGGARDGNHYYFVGGNMPSTSTWWLPVSNRRTYYKGSAGTYNFYFTAYKTVASSTNYIWNPTITATYVPTGYGAVLESPEVLSGAAAVGGDDQQTMTSPSPTLDLRELELRVAETQAAAERAQRQLVEARLQEQTRQRSAVTPAAAKKQ